MAAGAEADLTRFNRTDLRKRFSLLGCDLFEQDAVLYFTYSNLCDRAWQMRQEGVALEAKDTPQVLREPLPRRILTGWHPSNRLRSQTADRGD